MDKDSLVTIDWVLHELKLNDKPLEVALEQLCEKANNREINLYFSEFIRGTSAGEQSSLHEGIKRATDLSSGTAPNSSPRIVITEYEYQGKLYFSADMKDSSIISKILKPEQVFFDKSQIKALSKRTPKRVDGITKALALLAREIAEERGAKFRTGNNVNASTIKEHVLKLAERYNIENGYLKSLDDKLNKALNELDLKEIK